MKSRKIRSRLLRLALLAAPVAVACVGGCQSSGAAPRAVAGEQAAGGDTSEVGKGGAELWAENCGRCHNPRPLNSFSSAQWDVIAHHMRVRANLTAEEYREIRDYLTGTKH